MSAVIVESDITDNSNSTGPCLGSCYVPLLDPEEKLLATFYPNEVCISSLDGKLNKITCFKSMHRIVAYNTVCPFGLNKHWLLVLTEVNELYVLCLKKVNNNSIDILIIKHFKFMDLLMKRKDAIRSKSLKKTVIAQKCFIKVDQCSRFIVIHSCSGKIIILELKPSKRELFYLASINRLPREAMKTPELLALDKFSVFEQPIVHTLQSDIVFDISITRHNSDQPNWYISILTRDYKMDYSLHFYQIPYYFDTPDFKFYKFFKLPGYPNLMMTLDKFIILVFDSHHTLYAFSDVYLDHTLTADERNKAIQIDRRMATLRKNVYVDSGLRKFFKTYAKIDEKTLILTSATSDYYKVEIDLEFYPFLSTELRNKKNKSKELQKAYDLENTLTINKWKITQLTSRYKLNGLQPDELFYIPDTETFLSINKLSEIATFTLEQKNDPKILSLSNSRLPITDLKINSFRNSNSDSTLRYSITSGNLTKSKFKSPTFELTLLNELMKCHIFVSDYTVILNEVIIGGVTTSSSSDTIERLDIYSSNGDCIDTYEFEQNIKVNVIFPLSSPTVYLSDDNDFTGKEIQQVESLLRHSFVVVTSGNDYYDDDDDNEKSEILLFTINKNNELELKTMAVLNSKIDCIFQMNRRLLFLWGPKSVFKFGLDLYRDAETKQFQFKFKKVDEQLNLQINTTNLIKELRYDLQLLVDPYVGIYLASLDFDANINSIEKVFEWNMITAIDVFSEDIFVAGDILGNIFLFNVNYKKSEKPEIELFSRFNSTHGAIGSIACESPNRDDSIIKICYVGTADGVVLTIHIAKDLKNEKVVKIIKNFNDSVLEESKLNFEMLSKKPALEKAKISNKDRPVDCYFELEENLEGRFTKVLAISNRKIKKCGDVPII